MFVNDVFCYECDAEAKGSIYIKKNVCLSVCMFFMHIDTVQVSATKLSREHPLIQEKVNDCFLSKKMALRPQKAYLYT